MALSTEVSVIVWSPSVFIALNFLKMSAFIVAISFEAAYKLPHNLPFERKGRKKRRLAKRNLRIS